MRILFLAILLPAVCIADALDDCSDMLEVTDAPEYIGDDGAEHVHLCRAAYVLAYNSETKVPDWVLEDLTVDQLTGRAKRKDTFKADTDINESHRATLADYAGSGFDRGHMAPAADMVFSQSAMDESFLLSNMGPQVGIGFNRHIWKNLETATRDWARVNDRVIVITGPVYEGEELEVIGDGEVFVATHYYKIIYNPSRKRVLAFLIPNERLSGRKFGEFRVSVDDVEELTGIDFLRRLSARDERRPERGVDELWRRR